MPGGKVPAAQDGGRWVLSPALEVPSRPLSQAALPCARRSARAQRRCHLPQSYGQRDCAARGECHAQVGAAAFLPFGGRGGSGGVVQHGVRSVPLGTCLSFPAGDVCRRLVVQDGQRDGTEIWVLGLREGGTPGVGSAPPSPRWESYCGVGAWFLCGPPAVAAGSWCGVCRQGGLRRGAALVCITAGVVEIPEGFCASFLVSGSAVMKGGCRLP